MIDEVDNPAVQKRWKRLVKDWQGIMVDWDLEITTLVLSLLENKNGDLQMIASVRRKI